MDLGKGGPVTSTTDLLRSLAAAKGVDTDWWDWRGEHRQVPEAALRAVLTAMGEDVADEAAVHTALERVRTAPWRRTLSPTVVQREGDPLRLLVHVPHGSAVGVHVELEGGHRRDLQQLEHVVEPHDVDGTVVGEAAFEVPGDLPLGWHEVVAEVEAGPLTEGSERAVLVTVPQRLELPAVVQEQPRAGLLTQLYQVRGSGSQGIGDLGDLGTLGEWAAREHDAHFVLCLLYTSDAADE